MDGLLDILGSVSGKSPAAMIDGNEFVLVAQKYGLPTDMDSMNKIVNLVNSGMDVDSAARSLAGKGILGAKPKDRLRESYPSEDEFFKNRPDVGGMATIDNQVIINPYSLLSSDEKSAVYENELARIKMRSPQFRPNFSLTKEQEDYLDSNDYKNASELDRKATIAARILTGDSTAQTPTSEQLNFVASKLKNADGLLEVPATVGGLNASNYNNPFGLRAYPLPQGGYGGEMLPKSTGWLGLLQGTGVNKNQKMTEYSVGDEKGDFPSLVEGLTDEEKKKILSKGIVTKQAYIKAKQQADALRSQGKSPFYNAVE